MSKNNSIFGQTSFNIGQNSGSIPFGGSLFNGPLFGNNESQKKNNIFNSMFNPNEKKVSTTNRLTFPNPSNHLFSFENNIENNQDNKKQNSLFNFENFNEGKPNEQIGGNLNGKGFLFGSKKITENENNINNEDNNKINNLFFHNENQPFHEENNNNNNNNEPEKKNESEEEEEINDGKKEEKEKVEEKIVSEELNKPDELKSIDNKEYIQLINEKITNYKKELDSTVNKIELNNKELIQREKQFNNIKDLINISQNVINYIQDSLDNNTMELESIYQEQEKIISDLDNIENNLNQRIRNTENKNEILKENKDINNNIKQSSDNIEKTIEKCHNEMMGNTDKFVVNDKPKSLNDLLERIYWKIKKDIQGKEVNLINEIYNKEKNCIEEK